MNYTNPYIFGGNIILCIASGGHNTKLDNGNPIPHGIHYWNSDRLYEPPWKGHSNIHHDSSQRIVLEPNEGDGYTVGFSGYAARIEGSEGACSVRYYVKAGAGKHWAYQRDVGGGCNDCNEDESDFKDAVPGLDFEAKTGWLHWATGDTGIRHFAVKVYPNINEDPYTDDAVKRLCVVIDQPSGCGLKACLRNDALTYQSCNEGEDTTGLQYYEMKSIEAISNTLAVSSGSWPPKGDPRCGIYTHPFGDPVRDLEADQDHSRSSKKGPCTGWLGAGAPRLEWTVTIKQFED